MRQARGKILSACDRGALASRVLAVKPIFVIVCDKDWASRRARYGVDGPLNGAFRCGFFLRKGPRRAPRPAHKMTFTTRLCPIARPAAMTMPDRRLADIRAKVEGGERLSFED